MRFEVIDISAWPVMDQEAGGEEPKLWVAEDATRPRAQWWLYKPVKRGKETGYRRYDDVAERIACALAAAIGLPAADIELATRKDPDDVTGEGIISRYVADERWEMHPGDSALSAHRDYVSCARPKPPKGRPGHNLTNIRTVLDGVGGPPGDCADWPAFEVFAGYLAFDAWIANTDRHALNWAVLERSTERRLAASFDHGSALGSGIPEEHLARRDPVAFARKGMAGRFEGGSKRTLVDLALEAVTLAGGRASAWVDRIAMIGEAQIDEILAGVARLSAERRIFVAEVLRQNQRRLLDDSAR